MCLLAADAVCSSDECYPSYCHPLSERTNGRGVSLCLSVYASVPKNFFYYYLLFRSVGLSVFFCCLEKLAVRSIECLLAGLSVVITLRPSPSSPPGTHEGAHEEGGMKVSSARMLFAVLVASSALLITTTADNSTNNNNARQLNRGGGKGRGNQTSHDDYTTTNSGSGSCEDPAAAVLDLLHCVEMGDGACAAAAYHPDFHRFHNEVFTGEIAGEECVLGTTKKRQNSNKQISLGMLGR